MFHRMKFLQIQQLAFENSKEVFNYSIIQTVSLAAHALPDALLPKHALVLLVLILPALVRMENEVCTIRNLCKRLVQHGRHHAQYRTV